MFLFSSIVGGLGSFLKEIFNFFKVTKNGVELMESIFKMAAILAIITLPILILILMVLFIFLKYLEYLYKNLLIMEELKKEKEAEKRVSFSIQCDRIVLLESKNKEETKKE